MADAVYTEDTGLADLGEPVAEFRVRNLRYYVLMLGGIGAIVIGVTIPVLIAGAFLFGAGGKNGPNVARLGKVVFISIAALGAGVTLWQKSRRVKGLEVLAFTRGLARVQGGSVEVFRWEDIRSVTRIVRSSSDGGNSHEAAVQLVLADDEGWQFVLDNNIYQLEELRALVEERTLPQLLPPMAKALGDGQVVPFGTVALSLDGFHAGKEMLPWTQYDRGLVEGGKLKVYALDQRRPFHVVSTAAVPNVHVLLIIADGLRPRRG